MGNFISFLFEHPFFLAVFVFILLGSWSGIRGNERAAAKRRDIKQTWRKNKRFSGEEWDGYHERQDRREKEESKDIKLVSIVWAGILLFFAYKLFEFLFS